MYKNPADKHAANKRRYAAEPAWLRAEKIVATRLRTKGVAAKTVGGHKLPYDIVTRHLRIEVKSATFKPRRKVWTASIVRAGKMNEGPVDFYVIVLAGHPLLGFRRKDKRLYLVVKSPIRQRQVIITMHRLLTRWRDSINNWGLIVAAEKRRRRARA